MSRKGKIPVQILSGVEVTIADSKISVKGPKGSLEQVLTHGINVAKENDQIVVTLDESSNENKNFHGLYRTIIENLIVGVTKGFEKSLEMIGVGYRAAVKGKDLDLQVGLSHPSIMPIPDGIEVKVEKNTKIIISGIDKQKVGQFAATIRSIRPPEPYQGKGIRYVGEFVRRKAGKAAAKK